MSMYSDRDTVARQAHENINGGSQAAHRLIDEAAPVIDRLTARAQDMAKSGQDWLHDNSERVRSGVARASDRTVGYVRDEPVRSVLAAAAVGAVVYALARLLLSRRHY